MRRQIDYHLAQARAAASAATPGARCVVAESADGAGPHAHRLHAERGLRSTSSVPADHAVARASGEDLDEMIGNLLDNACKWSRGHVGITAQADDGQVVIAIEDDGDGVAEELWESVLSRGVRADEAAPGSGLGLAIVRDLAALYGGSVSLGHAKLGGLRAEVRLPR